MVALVEYSEDDYRVIWVFVDQTLYVRDSYTAVHGEQAYWVVGSRSVTLKRRIEQANHDSELIFDLNAKSDTLLITEAHRSNAIPTGGTYRAIVTKRVENG